MGQNGSARAAREDRGKIMNDTTTGERHAMNIQWCTGPRKALQRAVLALALLSAAAQAAHAQQTPTPPPAPGLDGIYYNMQTNPAPPIPPPSAPGSPITPISTILTKAARRVDATVDFGNLEGVRPAGVNADYYQVTWVGTVTIPSDGDYMFRINVDDGGRLWVTPGQPTATTTIPAAGQVNSWKDQGPTNHDSATMTLTAGQVLNVRMEFYEHGGGSAARLHWKLPGQTVFGAVPAYNGTSGLQTPVQIAAPVLVATSVPGAAQINLSWSTPTPSATPATAYNIFRATTSGAEGTTPIATGVTGTTYSDTAGIVFGQTYYYIVQGTACGGELIGLPSNEVSCGPNPFSVSPGTMMVIENAGTGTITLTTSAAIPAGDTVTVPVSVVNTTTPTPGPSSFTVSTVATAFITATGPATTITPILTGNGSAGQTWTITVTGVDDSIATNPQTARVDLGPTASANTSFSNHTLPSVTCTQIESDIAGIIVTPSSGLSTTNGGPPISFTVQLATIPSAQVDMTTSVSIPYQATVSPATLTFDASNWSTPQTVTITPLLVDTTTTYTTSYYVDLTPVQSSDPNYGGKNPGRIFIYQATTTPPLKPVWGSGGGGGGGCGLTGLESLLLLGLGAAWRRRRRS
jgi:hypothetical protein